MRYTSAIKSLQPAHALLYLFFIGIAVGTILLKLPFATTTSISWLDTLFTATSAMTVTGLVVVHTGSDFTLFGQIILLLLIQIGGVGIMTFAMLIFISLGKHIGFKERLAIQFAFNQTSLGGLIRLVHSVLLYSLLIEFLASLVLSIKFIPLYGFAKGMYYSIFHAVSAFNNAGFAIWDDSLTQFVGDPIINSVITTLIILGGLGFTVLIDMYKKRSFTKLSLHSKIMLISTVVVNLLATLLIFALEYHNPQTLGHLAFADKGWAAYFQAITTRTAGFNSVDIAHLTDTSLLAMLVLMFIGGGSASTAGGIKLTTAVILCATVIMFAKGRQEVVMIKRTIPLTTIFKAFAIVVLSALWIIGITFLLTISEQQPFLSLLFETISAFGTVGLSMDVTATLSIFGKLAIIATMMLGKLGPLTIMLAITRSSASKIRYPHEDVLTG